MNTSTKSKIHDFIIKNGRARPHDLVRAFGITQAAIHRHLNVLINEKKIVKFGKPPLVFYRAFKTKQTSFSKEKVEPHFIEFLSDHYLYISPDGKMLKGFEGFCEWACQTKQAKNETQLQKLLQEFVAIRHKADQFFQGKNWIEAIHKFHQTFESVYLDQVVYSDFYSLPKFGKTNLGQMVLHIKQSQNRKLVSQIAQQIKPTIEKLIQHYKIDAIGWVPHSIPRKLSFLKELKLQFSLSLPVVEIIKAYTGEIPVAQKSLSKLEERIMNADSSMFIKEDVHYKKILLIDDAVGSGATLNEIAKKIRLFNSVQKIIGYTIVGSYKGFEVIKEV